MKYLGNWQYQSIETLERDVWDESGEFPTGLVERCYKLRKKPISEFTDYDFRTMMCQQIGLKYLLPVLIESLKEDLFKGGLNRGDIIESILKIDIDFWKTNTKLWADVNQLIDNRRGALNQRGIVAKKFNNALK